MLCKHLIGIVLLNFICVIALAQTDTTVIERIDNPNGWIIRTRSSAYQLVIAGDSTLRPVYYGSRSQADYHNLNAAWNESIQEVPVRGGLPSKTPALEVVFADHVRDADLRYISSEVTEVRGRKTLKIVQQDKIYPLQVTSFIRVLPEYDVLEKWMEVKNTSRKEDIKIENLLSGSIVLPANEYVLTHWSGNQLKEFQQEHTSLTPGLKILQNKAFKSNFNPPWFAVQPEGSTGNNNGPVWFGALHYSGNWTLNFDKAFDGPLQILGGILFWDTDWQLKSGTTFETPVLAVGFTNQGTHGASRNMAAYVKADVLPAGYRHELRPVIYNSWETTFYNVNEQLMLDLATNAAELGVELFVIDDGWFKGRTDGKSQNGLGNWVPDSSKFPNGLTPVIKRVHELGMKFGLWVEPENINPNSDVGRAHPGWWFQFPNRPGNPYRKILNLANEDAYNYLLNSLTRLLQNNEIDFIKWDQNNLLSEPGWMQAPAAMQREARIRHVNNVYKLVDELRKRFPKVLFESCASGGGRVDLGMMSRMDQTWISDNTDPVDRLLIQYGFLQSMPANTMVAWVTGTTRHQPVSPDYRFNVSMTGVLGLSVNLTKWTPAERELAKQKIALYKKIRPVVQEGILYPLVSPFETNRCALQYNQADGKEAVIFCFNMAEYLSQGPFIDRGANILQLQGLDPNSEYQLVNAGNPNDKGTTYTGEFLMQMGIKWPVTKSFESQVLLLKKL